MTLGKCQPAFQAPLWHFSVFLTCNVRTKNGLPRTFSSGRVTSGKDETAGVIKEWLVEVEERHAGKAHEGTARLLHRNGEAEGEAVGVDRFGDYLRMNLDVRSEMARK